jgi:hypothetical protein
MRVHATYRCDHGNLLYVNAEVDLRYCGDTRKDPMLCRIEGVDSKTAYSGSIHTGTTRKANWITSDSSPSPDSGWWIATAIYEICFFNGGNVQGTAISTWALYESDINKVTWLTEGTATGSG